MRRPSFQFYPADWLGNSNLRRCTHAEKGVWLEVMCLMHDSPADYGLLRWPLAEIALAVGCPLENLQSLIVKGVMKGADTGSTCDPFIYVPRSGRKDGEPVTLILEQPGPVWYSSRMVRDEYVNKHRGEKTRFTGERQPGQPAGDDSSPTGRVGERQGEHSTTHLTVHSYPSQDSTGAQANRGHNLKIPVPALGGVKTSSTRPVGEEFGERQGDGPSSSSSLSSSKKKHTAGIQPGGFDQFWNVYPKKVAKPAAQKAFAGINPGVDLLAQMLKALERQRASRDWVKNEGQFIPNPATWLNQRRWEDEISTVVGCKASAQWVIDAGFANEYEASNAGCREHNAHEFRNGLRIAEVAA